MTIVYQINLLVKDCPNEGTDADEVGETVPENKIQRFKHNSQL